MTNEEFQQLVISELKDLKFDVSSLKCDVTDLKSSQQEMQVQLHHLNEKVDRIEVQQAENTGFIQALLHQTEELGAKYDGLLNVTASKDGLAKAEAKIDILNYRILAQEGEIRLLKQA